MLDFYFKSVFLKFQNRIVTSLEKSLERVFSSGEALLLIEQVRKNTLSGDFNKKW